MVHCYTRAERGFSHVNFRSCHPKWGREKRRPWCWSPRQSRVWHPWREEDMAKENPAAPRAKLSLAVTLTSGHATQSGELTRVEGRGVVFGVGVPVFAGMRTRGGSLWVWLAALHFIGWLNLRWGPKIMSRFAAFRKNKTTSKMGQKSHSCIALHNTFILHPSHELNHG